MVLLLIVSTLLSISIVVWLLIFVDAKIGLKAIAEQMESVQRTS